MVSQPSQAAEVTREATTNTGKTQYSSPLNENPVTEGIESIRIKENIFVANM